jgi:DNA repair photolyase
MKRWPQRDLRLDEKELDTDLGSGSFIFVGSSTDMWAEGVRFGLISPVLTHCWKYPENVYLFQSKNPARFLNLLPYTDFDVIYGTTIETNRRYPQMGKAPSIGERVEAMRILRGIDRRIMVTIEPIMDFDLEDLILSIDRVRPEWVNIGADSQGSHLPEPSAEKVLKLVVELEKITEVRNKRNLERILGEASL